MVGNSNIFLAQFPKYRHFFQRDCLLPLKFFQKYFDIRQPISIILGRAATCKHHTDAAYCDACRTFRGLCVYLCFWGTSMSPAKTAEPIDMQLGEGSGRLVWAQEMIQV